MKRIAIVIYLLTSLAVFAQNSPSTNEELERQLNEIKATIQDLDSAKSSHKNEILVIKQQLKKANDKITEMRGKIKANASAIDEISQQLGDQIKTIEVNTDKRINNVDLSLKNKSLYVIIGLFSAILVSILLCWILYKHQKSDKTNIIQQIDQFKSSIEENLVKELGKLTELVEAQLQFIGKQKDNFKTAVDQEPDHSLVLRVASEINTIERILRLMDEDVRGYKHLKRSVEKMKDNLNAHGYEIIDLLGKNYHPGLPVIIINSYPDEHLLKDQEIISKILIPAVRYNDKMIQSAQVEVNVGV